LLLSDRLVRLGSIFFQRYLDDYKDRDLTYGAKSGLAACAEQKGELAKAADQYWAVYQSIPDYSRPAHGHGRGALLSPLRQFGEGQTAYQVILDKYPDNTMVAEAKRRLAEMG